MARDPRFWLRTTIVLFPTVTWLALAEVPAGAGITTAEQLISATHDRYSQSWYRTLSFKQTVVRTNPDGTHPPNEVWAEYAEVPGKLRIDMGESYTGNGVIYANDNRYVFRNGALTRKTATRNSLLILGFDVYKQPPKRSLQVLKEEGFDLSKLHTDNWQGKAVYVVGAAAGDLRSPQFWVKQDDLLFVRILEPESKDSTEMSDIRFNKYQKLGGGWIAAEVLFLVDGKEEMREEYFDMQAEPQLPAGLFDPAKWGPTR